MADDQGGNITVTAAGESRAVALRAERIPVADIVPIFDTSRFDHYGRIAAVMAKASLIPEALKGKSHEETVANCFMVTNQADRWGMDPFSVAQCCSVQHGRLMFEGKLVSAVIRTKTGIEFDYHFTGERGKDSRRVYVSDKPFDEAIIAKLEPGGRYRGWRIIDGSIAEWKTKTKDGSVNQAWTNPQQADMQLCYRGGRVWARLYESAVMLGVYTDDEMEGLEHRQDVAEDRRQRRGKADLTARLPGPSAPQPEADKEQGFSNGHVEAQAEKAKGAAKAEPEPKPETIIEGPAPAGEAYFLAGQTFGPDGRRPVWQDGEPCGESAPDDQIKTYADHAPRPTQGSDARTAEGDKDTSASATDASGGSAAETSSQAQPDEPSTAGGDPRDAGEQSQPTSSASPEPELDDIMAFVTVTAPNAKTWLEVKGAMANMMKTAAWADAEPHETRGVRVAAWGAPARITEKVDPGQDPTAFRCWLEVADDEDAVDGTLALLENSPMRARLRDDQWKTLTDAAGAAKVRIRG